MMNNSMYQNRAAMGNIKVVRNMIFICDVLLCLFDLAFYLVGGFMFFFLFDLIAVASSYIAGAISFRNQKLHFVLIAVNLAAVVLYIAIHPVDKFLYITSIIQHIFCFLQLLCFTKLGEKEESLMNEEGYPYFTDETAHMKKFKEYVPDNKINSKTDNMGCIDTNDLGFHRDKNKQSHIADSNYQTMNEISDPTENTNFIPRRSADLEEKYMDEISDLNVSNDLKNFSQDRKEEMMEVRFDDLKDENTENKEDTDKEDYCQKFNTKVREYKTPEHLCDPKLMAANKLKMNAFKTKKKILFLGDALFIINSIFLIFSHTVQIITQSPAYLLISLNIAAVVSASLITETCLDNIKFCRKMLAVYLGLGIVLCFLCFEYTVPITFFWCAAQMFSLEFLHRENNYLSQQEGYPYFNEAALSHQKTAGEYSLEREIDFSPKKMDNI